MSVEVLSDLLEENGMNWLARALRGQEEIPENLREILRDGPRDYTFIRTIMHPAAIMRHILGCEHEFVDASDLTGNRVLCLKCGHTLYGIQAHDVQGAGILRPHPNA